MKSSGRSVDPIDFSAADGDLRGGHQRDVGADQAAAVGRARRCSCTTRIRVTAVGAGGISTASMPPPIMPSSAERQPHPAPAAHPGPEPGEVEQVLRAARPRRGSLVRSSRNLPSRRPGRPASRRSARLVPVVGSGLTTTAPRTLMAGVAAGLGEADQLPRGPGARGDHDEHPGDGVGVVRHRRPLRATPRTPAARSALARRRRCRRAGRPPGARPGRRRGPPPAPWPGLPAVCSRSRVTTRR